MTQLILLHDSPPSLSSKPLTLNTGRYITTTRHGSLFISDRSFSSLPPTVDVQRIMHHAMVSASASGFTPIATRHTSRYWLVGFHCGCNTLTHAHRLTQTHTHTTTTHPAHTKQRFMDLLLDMNNTHKKNMRLRAPYLATCEGGKYVGQGVNISCILTEYLV